MKKNFLRAYRLKFFEKSKLNFLRNLLEVIFEKPKQQDYIISKKYINQMLDANHKLSYMFLPLVLSDYEWWILILNYDFATCVHYRFMKRSKSSQTGHQLLVC